MIRFSCLTIRLGDSVWFVFGTVVDPEFLHASGKPASEIIREYELTASTFHKWVKQFNQTGSFKEADNRTPEEKELIALRKQNKQLLMENDILKQAALIMGRK